MATAALIFAVAPSYSWAQNFSFGFSTGHHHHGHYHGHRHGHWHGPGWWGPSLGFIYAPPPVVQERVVYVQPPRTAPPPANYYPPPSPSSEITIRNSSGKRLPVSFLIDGQDVELRDGEERTFSASQSIRTVRYDRGGRFGSTENSLAPGDYEFRVTPSGWDLARLPDAPAAARTATRPNQLPQ
jgi:hypothetical protein